MFILSFTIFIFVFIYLFIKPSDGKYKQLFTIISHDNVDDYAMLNGLWNMLTKQIWTNPNTNE